MGRLSGSRRPALPGPDRQRRLDPLDGAVSRASCTFIDRGARHRGESLPVLRTQEGGGTFAAPLAVDVRMSFIPVKPAQTKARKLELVGSFTFPGNSVPWSFARGANFLPGLDPARSMDKACCREYACHAEPGGKEHCYWSLPPECWNLPCTEDPY